MNDAPSSESGNAYQALLEKTYERRIPFSAHWELTYRCNLSCVHCYATDRQRKGELSTAEILRVLDQLAEANCLFLCFTGGEIFCRNDLLDVLRAAKSRGFAFRLLTNGALLTPKLADTLVELTPLSVEFSLYALNPAIHERITTVKGSHGKTMAAIRLCRERGLNTVVKSVLLKSNLGEFATLSGFAKELGARFVFDFLLAPSDDGARPMAIHGLSEDELCGFFLRQGRLEGYRGAVPARSEPVCGQGGNTLAITPFGDVLPCLAIRKSVGNLRDRTFREIWHNSALEQIRCIRYAHLHECGECLVAGFCVRCSGMALAECGNILGRSESACLTAHAMKRAVDTFSTKEKAG